MSVDPSTLNPGDMVRLTPAWGDYDHEFRGMIDDWVVLRHEGSYFFASPDDLVQALPKRPELRSLGEVWLAVYPAGTVGMTGFESSREVQSFCSTAVGAVRFVLDPGSVVWRDDQ